MISQTWTATAESATLAVALDSDDFFVVSDNGFDLITKSSFSSPRKFKPFQKLISPSSLAGLPWQEARSQNEVSLMIGSTDGMLHMCQKNGSIVKSIKCHDGAVLSIAFSRDGSFFLTGGEEGLLKIWTKNGALKGILADCSSPIISVSFSPGSNQAAYVSGNQVFIRSITRQDTSLLQLKGHSRQVNSISWCSSTKQLLSSSDDGTYRMWNPSGDCLFKSKSFKARLSHARWCPKGGFGLVAKPDGILLIGGTGVVLSTFTIDGIVFLEWSIDGKQALCLTESQMISLTVLGKKIRSKQQEVMQTEPNRLMIKDMTDNSEDLLSYPSVVTDYCLSHSHLVTATTTSIQVHSSRNWQSPTTLDVKKMVVHMVLICHKYAAAFGLSSLMVFSFDSKSLGTVRWQTPHYFNKRTATISNSLLGIVDPSSNSELLLADIDNNLKLPDRLTLFKKYKHKRPILTIAAEPASIKAKSTIAFLDSAMELHVLTFAGKMESQCFATNVDIFCWHMDFDMIAIIADRTLQIWDNVQTVPPSIKHLVKPLFNKPLDALQISHISFDDQEVQVLADDQTETVHVIPRDIIQYSQFASIRDNAKLLRLCGQAEDASLWSNLAAYSLLNPDLKTAEVALTNIGDYSTLYYIKSIQKLSRKDDYRAEMALFLNDFDAAEAIYTSNKNNVDKAIEMNFFCGRWKRAEDLASKHGLADKFQELISKITPEE